MKAKVTFAALAGAALLACPAFGQEESTYWDFPTAELYQTDERIVIDGVADEAVWATATEYKLENVLHNWGTSPVENTWGYAVSFKATYNDNYLFLFVSVTDDTYVPFADKMTAETNIDNIELYFYPDPAGRSVNDETTVNDYRSSGLSQLRVSIGNEDNRATGGGYVKQFVDATTNYLTGYQYKTVQTDKGYDAEILLRWDNVISADFAGNLQPGGRIMFDVNAANCTDYASGRVIMLGWSTNDFNDWKDNKRLGEIEFKGPAASGIKAVEAAVDYTFAQGVLSMDVENGTPVSVLDLSGRTVASYVYDSAIDLSSLASGIYMVKAENAAAFKIVK